MSKKHFEALANKLASTRPAITNVVSYSQWLQDVKAIVEVCVSFNANCNADKLIEACKNR